LAKGEEPCGFVPNGHLPYSPTPVRLQLKILFMNTCRLLKHYLPVAALTGLLCLPVLGADASLKTARPAIYDEKADGAKQIAEALSVAKKEHKLVLLQFGANWCGWCHKLHRLFASDEKIAAKLKEAYVVVLVDVNKGHNAAIDEKYGKPTKHGLPVIVVLDTDGKPLVTQDTGKLEAGDHHDPAKVLAFLNQWAGKKI
jgi:thiol:disulfide interchange protein